MTALLSNDNLVTLAGLKDDSTGAYVNTSVNMTAQVYLSDYTTTLGSPFTLSYIVASNGNYAGTMPYTLTANADGQYVLRITGDGGGLHYDAWIPLLFVRRAS